MTQISYMLRPNLGQIRRLSGWLCVWLGMLLPLSLSATHNIAGQITAEKKNPNDPSDFTYIITLTTYTDPAPAGVDRCSATIWVYTNGNSGRTAELENIPRANGPLMNPIPNDCQVNGNDQPRNGIEVKSTIKENIYRTEYRFTGAGTYTLVYNDLARFGGIVNMNDPESQPFSLTTEVFVLPPTIGGNSSVVLLNEPLDDACVGEIWTHQPGAWDSDGDSLSYELIPSEQFDEPSGLSVNNPGPVDGYRFPDDPAFGNSSFTVDPITGLMTWEAPPQPGIYNIGILVTEWRAGLRVGRVQRDMAIFVKDCDNRRPVIETITDTCVYAGDTLRFDFLAYDPDSTDSLYLDLNNGSQGDNGPFIVDNPASLSGEIVDLDGNVRTPYLGLPQATWNFDNPSPNQPDTIKGRVVWPTVCANIRRQHYQIDFRANDNNRYSINNSPTKNTLVTYRTVVINVIPPPPTNLVVERGSDQVELSWDPPGCTGLVERYVIYRRSDGGELNQDTICCDMSPAELGFTQIADISDPATTTFADNLEDFEDGLNSKICYAVTAVFRNEGNLFLEESFSESCATSDCIDLTTDPIYLTNDSIGVAFTDSANGKVFVSWSQPAVDVIFPAPYTYRLYRANNNGFPAIEVARLDYGDTTYLDSGFNTAVRGYNYRVEIFDALDRRISASDAGGTNQGTTIFLEAEGLSAGVIGLTWREEVPWTNDQYEIYRSEDDGPYQLIATVPATGADEHSYVDSLLNPSLRYCYFIRAIGAYDQVEAVKSPLINDSQVACDFAQDDEPPCPPEAIATGDCNTGDHQVLITKPNDDCDSDAGYVIVEYASRVEGPFREIQRVNYDAFGSDTTLIIRDADRGGERTGCYAIRAVDTLGNISALSTANCVNFCPALEMPNVFTPNNDGRNDNLHPREGYRDVLLVNFKLFDRYGRLMHETSQSIDNLWDGLTPRGKLAPEGVYFYVLRYEEQDLIENRPMMIKGTVTLLR
jgi:gliding motility-associated-like protein